MATETLTSTHGNTFDGDQAEGLSFTNLAITNFMDNGSGFTEADFTDLTFSSISFLAVGNNQDGVNFSFTGFPADGATPENQGLDDTDGFTAGTANPYDLAENLEYVYCSSNGFVPAG